MMIKLNACLLIVAFLSALVLISMRSQTRGYFDQAENQRRLIINLEAQLEGVGLFCFIGV